MKRREWIRKGGAAAAGVLTAPYAKSFSWMETKLDCAFQLSVITDEITQDFGHANQLAAKEYGE
jgi:hypothetical protein